MGNLTDKASNIKNGIGILAQWLGSGGIAVDQGTAQVRTNTCLGCCMNQPGPMVTESIASIVKSQMEFKKKIGLKTAGMKSLKTCSVCDCYLPLKIWIPIDRIRPQLGDNFPDHCWIIKESQ